MKLLKLLLLMFTFALIPVALLAQGAAPGPPGEYGEIFLSITALAGAIPFITEFLKSQFNITNSLTIQIVSGIVGIGLSFAGYWFQLGMFVGIGIWGTILIGIGAALISNGVFDTGLITFILKLLGYEVPQKPQKRHLHKK